MNDKVQTDFLFAQPSLLSGAARLLDFAGQLDDYNFSDSDEEADYNALLSDWAMVGQDMYFALDQFERSLRNADAGGKGSPSAACGE